MKSGSQATLIVGFVGMSVLIGLTVWHGADHVGDAMVSAGWASVLVVLARGVAVAMAGAGWWLLFPREQRPSISLCIGIRFVREGANALLPLAQIGGDFIGARCLALRGVRGPLAAASVIVDVLMQAISQLVFAIIGLILLMSIGGNGLIVWPVAVGIALALPALGGFLLVQGEFGQRLVKQAAGAVCGRSELAGVRGRQRSVRAAQRVLCQPPPADPQRGLAPGRLVRRRNRGLGRRSNSWGIRSISATPSSSRA